MSFIKTDLAAKAHRSNTVDAYQVSVERAIRHMKQNIAEPLDLERLAEVAAVS